MRNTRPLKLLVDWLVYIGLRMFLGLVGILPRFLAHGLCRGVADLVFRLDRRHRRVGMLNLEIAFPEKDERWRTEILRESFQQIGDQLVEISRMHRLRPETVKKRFAYESGRGLDHYLEAKRESGAVLFLTAHLSAWEILPAVHALYGNPLHFVVRPLDNRFLESWATRLRTRFGNRLIPKQGSMRRVLRVLKEGGDVGFLMDQNIQEQEGVYVPLFGHPASTSTSLTALALRTSLPIVAGFIYPTRPRGYYRIRFYPPIRLHQTGDGERDLLEGTARLNRYIEEVVREYPQCWLWGHRRFHTQARRSPYEEE